MNLKRLVLAGSVFLAVQFTLSAAVTLTLENPGSAIYQQTYDHPCVIGDPSCSNPAGFGFTTIPAGPTGDNYDLTSPTYTVAQIRALVGNLFFVGIDVNSTTKPLATEQLDLFSLSIGGVIQFIYDPASPGTVLQTVNNGTGYSDEILRGFDLTAFAASDTAVFRAVVNNATAGREEFFLASTTATPVPEPTSVLLLGTALIMAGKFLRGRIGA